MKMLQRKFYLETSNSLKLRKKVYGQIVVSIKLILKKYSKTARLLKT